MRLIRYSIIQLCIIASLLACDKAGSPDNLTILATRPPEVDGNEIIFKQVYTLEDDQHRVEDIRIHYTAWDGCGTDHWIYDPSLGIWRKFTSRSGDICTDALVPTSINLNEHGFPISEYITPQGELRLRYGSVFKLPSAHLSQYSLDLLGE